MSYDPLKALGAAGVLQGELPNSLKKAISSLSQDEVDLIISAKNDGSSSPASWAAPAARQMQGDVAQGCACGLWSGSGSGPAENM